MTDETAKSTEPTVPMRLIGALAGVVLGALLTVSVLHFVKLGCITALSGELYICSMLTWVYIGWPVLAISALVGGTRGMLLRSRPEFSHWTRLVWWVVVGWVIGLFGQVGVIAVVAVAEVPHETTASGLVVEEVRDAPPPVERGRSVVETILATAFALPALGAFTGTYAGWRRWKRATREEESGTVGPSTESSVPS